MGEVGGELAEGGQLFGLHLNAGDFADAVEQDGDAALRHGRDGGQHLGKQFSGDVERPDLADGVAGAAVAFHAGVGQQAGDLAHAGDEEGDVAALRAADVHLAAQHDVHPHGGVAFAEHQGIRVRLCARGRARRARDSLGPPCLERGNLAQGGYDLGDRTSALRGETARRLLFDLGSCLHGFRVYLAAMNKDVYADPF